MVVVNHSSGSCVVATVYVQSTWSLAAGVGTAKDSAAVDIFGATLPAVAVGLGGAKQSGIFITINFMKPPCLMVSYQLLSIELVKLVVVY